MINIYNMLFRTGNGRRVSASSACQYKENLSAGIIAAEKLMLLAASSAHSKAQKFIRNPTSVQASSTLTEISMKQPLLISNRRGSYCD